MVEVESNADIFIDQWYEYMISEDISVRYIVLDMLQKVATKQENDKFWFSDGSFVQYFVGSAGA